MKTVLRMLLPLLVLGLTGGVVYWLVKNKQEIKPKPRVEVLPLVEVRSVKPGSHQLVVRSQGEVAARTEIDLVSEVAGKINWVADEFAAGGFFRQGEVLAKIDPRDFEVAITQAEAAVAQGRVGLERELAEAKVALKEWEELGKGKASSLLLREPQLAQAEADLRSALANLQKAKLDLSRCSITAPFTGRIRLKHVDVGQFANRGTPIARVYAVDYVEVSLPLPLDELDYLNLSFGQSENQSHPEVVLRARLGATQHEWTGRLVRTAAEINTLTRMLNGIVRVDDPYGLNGKTNAPLSVGLFVQAEIKGKLVHDVYRVPRAAMRGLDQLMVIDGGGVLRFRTVEVLRFLQEEVLLKRGIEGGDRVCVSLLAAPVDGMKVEARELTD